MTMSIEAVYEGGFFKPTMKVTLAEGTHVEVIIPQTGQPRGSQRGGTSSFKARRQVTNESADGIDQRKS